MLIQQTARTQGYQGYDALCAPRARVFEEGGQYAMLNFPVTSPNASGDFVILSKLVIPNYGPVAQKDRAAVS